MHDGIIGRKTAYLRCVFCVFSETSREFWSKNFGANSHGWRYPAGIPLICNISYPWGNYSLIIHRLVKFRVRKMELNFPQNVISMIFKFSYFDSPPGA